MKGICPSLAAAMMLFVSASEAEAWWRVGLYHRWGYYHGAYYPTYYGAAPGYYSPATYPVTYAPVAYPAVCGATMPVAHATTTPYAAPQAAPPSQTAEPPAAAGKKPTITESRSRGGSYPAVAKDSDALPVGFWNATGRDLKLTVNGQPHLLRRNQALNLRLDRSFTWQRAGDEPHQEQLPDSQMSHEVILRP